MALIQFLGGIRATVFAGLLLITAGLLGWQWTAKQAVERGFAAHLAADAKAEVLAERAAREKEQAHALRLADLAAVYEQEKNDAKATHDRVVADLRAGNLRLQERWSRCAVPAAVAPAGELDAGADDRAEGAAAIVRAAAEADAQIRGLQAVIRADRGEP